MSSRWRWLSGPGRWDSPLERYGQPGRGVLPFQGTHTLLTPGWFQKAAKIFKLIQRNDTCRVLFLQLCQVNARPEVAVIYSPGFSDPSPLPVAVPAAAHNFTRFFKGGKYKIHHKGAQSLFFPLHRHLCSSLYRSFHFLQQTDSISDPFSVNYCLVIFQLFSSHNFLLLNSLNVLSAVNERTPCNC